jgi:hypothetical protein
VGTSGVRFADGETLQTVLATAQGHVSPLAIINDQQKQVSVLLDKTLADAELVVRHSMSFNSM